MSAIEPIGSEPLRPEPVAPAPRVRKRNEEEERDRRRQGRHDDRPQGSGADSEPGEDDGVRHVDVVA